MIIILITIQDVKLPLFTHPACKTTRQTYRTSGNFETFNANFYRLSCKGIYSRFEMISIVSNFQGTHFPLILSPRQVVLYAGQMEILKPVMHFSCFYHTHDKLDKRRF